MKRRKFLRLAASAAVVTCGQQAPDGLRSLQKTEIEKWWPIIKAANTKGE